MLAVAGAALRLSRVDQTLPPRIDFGSGPAALKHRLFAFPTTVWLLQIWPRIRQVLTVMVVHNTSRSSGVATSNAQLRQSAVGRSLLP